MWPDNEIADDLIGFRVHADLIRALVTNPKMLPLTIGVFGDWGGGKTSIMKMLQQDLEPEKWPAQSAEHKAYENVAVLYFNTWQFEGYDDAKAAILSSVLMHLGESKRFGPKLRDKIVPLLKSVNWMRVVRLGFKHVALPAAAAFLTGGAAAIPAAIAASAGVASLLPSSTGSEATKGKSEDGEKIDWADLITKDQSSSEVLDVRTFRNRFSKMLADSDIKSLVVLVDDLDRCTPDRIIDNLEAIKLFLNVERTAFLIGADPRIVQHAIRARYAEGAVDNPADEEAKQLVKDYLEKLIQVPYRLPRLSASEIETYMVLLFAQYHLSEPDFQLCLASCEQERNRNRYSSFGYAAVKGVLNNRELEEAFSTALTFCAAAAPLIADGLKGNPRQVKRFLNALLLRKQLAQVAKLQTMRDDVLVKLMILEYAHEKRFLQLFAWQATQEGHPKQLAALEEAAHSNDEDVEIEEAMKKLDADWASMPLRKWLAMEPRLKGVDLRDYFWVARDRLESTFSGLSMVPPIVRTVLDGLLSGNAVKRNASVKTVGTLREDERLVLLNLIDQHVTRQPEEKIGYEALRVLADASVAGAAELLGTILKTRPPERMPPSVGQDVMTLIKAKPALGPHLQPAIDRLKGTDSKIGRSVKSAK